MTRFEIQFPTTGKDSSETLTLSAPDVTTAMVVAEITHQGRVAELWQGKKRIARMVRHAGGLRGFWSVI